MFRILKGRRLDQITKVKGVRRKDMTGKEAIKKFTDYLKNHNIYYVRELDNGCIRYTMQYKARNAPDGYVESCIWFYEEDNAEVRVYYNQAGADICKASQHRNALLELLNFINARVFLSCGDVNGLYEPHMLYTPRIYQTTDGFFDITITTIINYDFWAVATVETADYMTIYCPELLDMLAIPIFELLEGMKNVDEAISYINENMLRVYN